MSDGNLSPPEIGDTVYIERYSYKPDEGIVIDIGADLMSGETMYFVKGEEFCSGFRTSIRGIVDKDSRQPEYKTYKDEPDYIPKGWSL